MIKVVEWQPMETAPKDGTRVELFYRVMFPGWVGTSYSPPTCLHAVHECYWGFRNKSKGTAEWKIAGVTKDGYRTARYFNGYTLDEDPEPICWRPLPSNSEPDFTPDEAAKWTTLTQDFDRDVRMFRDEHPVQWMEIVGGEPVS